jgi:hypothetical protein
VTAVGTLLAALLGSVLRDQFGASGFDVFGSLVLVVDRRSDHLGAGRVVVLSPDLFAQLPVWTPYGPRPVTVAAIRAEGEGAAENRRLRVTRGRTGRGA